MMGSPPEVGNTPMLVQRNCSARLFATMLARACVESRVYNTLLAFSSAVSMLMGTWPSMRWACTIWPVGLRTNTLTAIFFSLAKATQACVIFSAVSAEISLLDLAFLASSPETTNLSIFCALAAPANTTSAAANILICLILFSSSLELLCCYVGGNREDVIGGKIRDHLFHQRR